MNESVGMRDGIRQDVWFATNSAKVVLYNRTEYFPVQGTGHCVDIEWFGVVRIQ